MEDRFKWELTPDGAQLLRVDTGQAIGKVRRSTDGPWDACLFGVGKTSGLPSMREAQRALWEWATRHDAEVTLEEPGGLWSRITTALGLGLLAGWVLGRRTR